MSLFHDEENGPLEPVPGLPERLPEGETILWQGRPSGLAMMFGTFRIRWILGYFVVMTAGRIGNLSANGAGTEAMTNAAVSSVVMCVAALCVIGLLAWVTSRAALFTVTDHRIVLRFGAALRKYINIPFDQIVSADLNRRSPRIGDIAFKIEAERKIGYVRLWPFARPFHFANPQPMMRSLKDAESVAALIARAVKEHAPETVSVRKQTKPEAKQGNLPAGAAPA